MTDNEEKIQNSEPSPIQETLEETEPQSLEDLCFELQKQNEELQDKYTRLWADFENYKKRTQRQNRDLVTRANESLICGLLPVIDNFCLALGSVQNESLSKGIKMIYHQLIGVLESEGLVAIESLGCPFNPSIHEAVAHAESPEHEDNIVVEEFRKGYMLAGKAIRPGMVKVNIKKEE